MILEKFGNLSSYKETEKLIISYILQHLNDLDKITISTLAKETFTSNSTIIRFCKKFDCEGFSDFKIKLIKETQYYYQNIKSIDPDMPFAPTDTLNTISRNLYELIKSNLKKTMLTINSEDISKAVYFIVNAKRIFVFGKGDSYLRAKIFKNRMIKIDKYIILADAEHEGPFNARNVTKDDCVIFLTYTAMHYDYNNYIDIFNALKVPTVIITSNKKSSLSKKCDISLIVPEDESFDSKIACFASQMSFEYLLDVLYSAIFVCDYQTNYKEKQLKEKYTNKIISTQI